MEKAYMSNTDMNTQSNQPAQEQPPLVSAQGGQDDTQRAQPQGNYQQTQSQESQQPEQAGPTDSQAQEQPPLASAQGGQDDTQRAQPQGNYQQKQ